MSSIKKNGVKSQKSDASKRDMTPIKDLLSDSSTSTNASTNARQQRQKEAMQKLASNFKKKSSEKKITEKQRTDSWSSLIQNVLNSQRGKLPLLLAVEAGNQSMVRELLSAQTTEQLKVSRMLSDICIHFCGQV